jgi:hypothetical protein
VLRFGYGVETDPDGKLRRTPMNVLGRKCVSAKLYAVSTGREGDVDAAVDDEHGVISAADLCKMGCERRISTACEHPCS